MSDETVDAVRSIRTGAVIPLNDRNRKRLSAKSEMVLTQAKLVDGQYVDVNADAKVAGAGGTRNLQRIGEQLAALERTREQLIGTALRAKGGEAFLDRMGIAVPDGATPAAEGFSTSPVEFGTVDVSDDLAARIATAPATVRTDDGESVDERKSDKRDTRRAARKAGRLPRKGDSADNDKAGVDAVVSDDDV